MATPRLSVHGGHSTYGDGTGRIWEFAQAAQRAGLIAFGFSEHLPEPNHRTFRAEVLFTGRRDRSWYDDYVEDVETARHGFAGSVDILCSIEIDYIRGAREWVRSQLARLDLDYVVGSVHYVRLDDEDVCIDADQESAAEAVKRAGGEEALFLLYLDHVRELLQWGIVDVVAHFDLVKMHFGAFPETPRLRTAVEETLELMRTTRAVLEINTRGLKKPCRRMYPEPWILRLAARIGVPLTLSDDSHCPEDVGFMLEEAAQLAHEAGYRQLTRFHTGGDRSTVPL